MPVGRKPFAYNSLWQFRNDSWSSLEEASTQLVLAGNLTAPSAPLPDFIDILPALKDGDSWGAAHAAPTRGSRFTGSGNPGPPRAVTACPAAMFLAAFTSALPV